MGDEYQLRRDVDKILGKTYKYDENIWNIYTKDEINKKLQSDYYDKGQIDEIVIGDISLDNYYTKTEIESILSSYVTIGYANSRYALINHTHSQYVTRDELHNLDIDITTIELVDYSENPNGVICFEDLGENRYIKKSSTSGLVKNDGTIDTTQYLSSLPSHNHDGRYYTETEVDTALNGKQATLVSGTNIKTINNTSLLGSGNIDIQGGGGSVIGTGSFSINNNGHLIVELPNGVDNPYFINSNGHLIYDTSNTHNGS